MKVLVTGAAGFIGYHVARRLAESRRCEVLGIDNLNDYYSVELKRARLTELEQVEDPGELRHRRRLAPREDEGVDGRGVCGCRLGQLDHDIEHFLGLDGLLHESHCTRAERPLFRIVGGDYAHRQVARAEAMGHVETLQPPFSMIRRDTAADLLPWCHAHGTGVICYSPMQAGLLTGSFTRQRAESLDENDWRKASELFDDGFVLALERRTDHLGAAAPKHLSRQRVWRLRARSTR